MGFLLLRRYFINNGMYDHLPARAWKHGIYDGRTAINTDKSVTFSENHDLEAFSRMEPLSWRFASDLSEMSSLTEGSVQ